MAEVRIEFHCSFYSERAYRDCIDKISKEVFPNITWRVLEHDIDMKFGYRSSADVRKMGTGYIQILKRFLNDNPDDKQILQKLREAEERALMNIWDIALFYSGNIDADINLDENYLAFIDQPKIFRDDLISDVALFSRYPSVDEDFYSQLRQFGLGAFLSILFSQVYLWDYIHGDGIIYLDNTRYKQEWYFEVPLFSDMIANYGDFFTEKVTFGDCWDWIAKNTSLCGIKARSPVYFSSTSYIFNRESYESLLYLNMAFESLYVKPNSKNISEQIQKNVNSVFTSISKDQLRKLYKLRSQFVHGDTDFSILNSYLEYEYNEELQESLLLGATILFETIRKLIKHNATKITFSEQITYNFK